MPSCPRSVRPLRVAGMVVAALTVTLALASCTGTDDRPAPARPSVSAASASPSPSPSAHARPQLVPDGTATQNLPVFRAVTERVWKGHDRAHGRAYVDALAQAGFDKDAMQVTEDRSTVDHAAESLQFSVRWPDGQCLVGQVGPATGDPVTAVMPQLQDGMCLLGATRTIDW